MVESATGTCVKCDSQISAKADRCPECGYEPGPGILGGLIMWVSGMLASVFVTIALVTLIVLATGSSLVAGLTVFVFTGSIGAALIGIVYAGYKNSKRGPTDQPAGNGESKAVGESWQDGAERGEEIADSIGSIGPAIIDALPGWTWTVGVLLGIVLHLSLWVATAGESEIGMGVGLIGGMLISLIAIVADTRRIKWTTDYSPRSWFWMILGAVPLFGWVFGFIWLLRKRQKTGYFVA